MNAPVSFTARVATLAAPDDFTGWRERARSLLTGGVPPDNILWQVEGEGSGDLFAPNAPTARAVASPDPGFRISRALLATLRSALLHSDPARFALGYRILWRARVMPSLHTDPSDPDMIALHNLAKAVRRDIHKMHAFVRFRKVVCESGRERFAAWFEPEHHIGRAVAGFFRDRFAGMDWMIVTPEVSIAWDGAALHEGPGGCRSDVPPEDAVEAEWRAYYASIFNPARVKIAAMKREMPVKYWKNLPEAVLIPGMIDDAERRVDAMVRDRVSMDLPLFGAETDAPEPEVHPQLDSLTALYATLRRDDVAPAPQFSDRLVMGEGAAGAPLLFVGEQPGDQEDLKERPFVGPAGQLFDQCLSEAGIDRARTYVTNAVKRFKFEPRGKRRVHSTPNAADIAHYRWWLEEEIRLVGPRIVVALGATALHALSGKRQTLSSLRGDLLGWKDRKMLVTVHPSFLLRLPDEQARTIERDRFVRELRVAAKAASQTGIS